MIPSKELPPKLSTNLLNMHEVAVASTVAAVLLKLSAGGLTEVSYRGEVHNDRASRVESALESLKSSSSLVFLLELDVHIADHVISKVVTNVEALNFSKLGELFEDVFIEVLKVFLDLSRVDRLPLGVYARGYHVGPLVHVGEKEGGRDGGPVVQSRAPVAMPACTDLEIERAIDTVFLCAEYGRQVLRH